MEMQWKTAVAHHFVEQLNGLPVADRTGSEEHEETKIPFAEYREKYPPSASAKYKRVLELDRTSA